MKKKIFAFLSIIFIIIAIYLSLGEKIEAREKPVHHLLYDKIDDFYYCLGSPLNC